MTSQIEDCNFFVRRYFLVLPFIAAVSLRSFTVYCELYRLSVRFRVLLLPNKATNGHTPLSCLTFLNHRGFSVVQSKPSKHLAV